MASTIESPVTQQPNYDGKPISQLTIGEYLIKRLQDYGVRDLFGIPGDYVLHFYTQLTESPLNVIGCTREDNAGFAADAYARIRGLGVVCVTYCVGGLSCCNSIAGAFAEKSPVLLISGAPGLAERRKNPMLHHQVGDFKTQFEVLRQLCIAAADLNDPTIAFREIDRVLDAIVRLKRPGYLELPRDMVDVVPNIPHVPVHTQAKSNEDALSEAVQEATRRLEQSKRPVLIAGVEIHRFGLQNEVLHLVEAANIPFVTTAHGKSVMSEKHPLYAGLYEGAMGRPEVSRFVEESDCILLLGDFMHDINSGVFTAQLDPTKSIQATSELLRISHHHFHDVLLADFISNLAKVGFQAEHRELPPKPQVSQQFDLRAAEPMTIARLVERLNFALDESTVVVADVGDALFASLDLNVLRQTKFLSPAYYTSMGFAVPAALGVQVAQRDLRPIVLVGDGAFQMTGMELSNIVKRKLNPVIILLDNKGYGTERFLHEGEWDFNDIHPWNYHKLPEVLNGGKGYHVKTEGEFDQALTDALANRQEMSLIQVKIDVSDSSRSLRRLAENLIPKS